ncbi:MAG: molybdenum cofactor biosynthesis protein B [Gemmatimonadota bacterium]
MNSVSSEQHRQAAAERGPVGVAIVTVSDSRTPDSDVNGIYLREQIEATGHRLAGYRIIPDEPALVDSAARELSGPKGARIVIFNGGTGIASRDNTFDALSALLEKSIPGFGELFRMLSWEQVGAAAMLSRATAGTFNGSVIISIPGSPAAVRLAWEKLIEPELQHLAWELGR